MNIIELQKVSKEYYLGTQSIPVLYDIDLEVKLGEFVAIMGPSGSGKSTLMNIIGCLDIPTSGVYMLNGTRIESLNDNQLSLARNADIGFVFQKFNLLQESNLIQNISLPLVYRGISKEERQKLAIEVAQNMGISSRFKHKPTELSGGQAQRVAIARALIGKPKLILADEPTGNLDSKTGQEIMQLFNDLHEAGHTIIMVTHDENIAKNAEKIIFLKDGKIESQVSTGKQIEKKTSLTSSKVSAKNFKLSDLLAISIKEGLFSHPLRTFLTMLGVLFGVAAVIAMVAINEGARQEAMEQIQQLGLNNIRLRSIKMSKEEIKEARRNMSQGLNHEDLEAVLKIPTIRYAVPLKEMKAEISLHNRKPRGKILATAPAYEKVFNFYVEEGRFILEEDVEYYQKVCVLGKSMQQELFGNQEAIGQKIFLGAEVFWVIGVMESKNAPKGVAKAVSSHDLNHNIYIPISTAEKRFQKIPFDNKYDEISIMVFQENQIHSTSQLLTKVISERHHEVNDFEIVVPEELLRQSRKTQEIFDIVMVCIAGISLVVGGIGIMNIMLANVTERIPEIGIRRAIGANRTHILKQFLVEALAISIMGGILGIMLGWFITITISHYTGWKTIVSFASMMLGFSVSAIVGIIFGIYPAWKASLLNPIAALNSI